MIFSLLLFLAIFLYTTLCIDKWLTYDVKNAVLRLDTWLHLLSTELSSEAYCMLPCDGIDGDDQDPRLAIKKDWHKQSGRLLCTRIKEPFLIKTFKAALEGRKDESIEVGISVTFKTTKQSSNLTKDKPCYFFVSLDFLNLVFQSTVTMCSEIEEAITILSFSLCQELKSQSSSRIRQEGRQQIEKCSSPKSSEFAIIYDVNVWRQYLIHASLNDQASLIKNYYMNNMLVSMLSMLYVNDNNLNVLLKILEPKATYIIKRHCLLSKKFNNLSKEKNSGNDTKEFRYENMSFWDFYQMKCNYKHTTTQIEMDTKNLWYMAQEYFYHFINPVYLKGSS